MVENNFQDRPLPRGSQVILWIGDLDGDGSPDLIVDPAVEDYGAIFLQLFLSSRHKKGRFWKPAASYFYLDPGASESSPEAAT